MATFPTANPVPAPVRPTPSRCHARCCHGPGHGSPASQALPGLPASVHMGEGADALPGLKGKTHILHMAPGPCRPWHAAFARPPPPSGLRNLLESHAAVLRPGESALCGALCQVPPPLSPLGSASSPSQQGRWALPTFPAARPSLRGRAQGAPQTQVLVSGLQGLAWPEDGCPPPCLDLTRQSLRSDCPPCYGWEQGKTCQGSGRFCSLRGKGPGPDPPPRTWASRQHAHGEVTKRRMLRAGPAMGFCAPATPSCWTLSPGRPDARPCPQPHPHAQQRPAEPVPEAHPRMNEVTDLRKCPAVKSIS